MPLPPFKYDTDPELQEFGRPYLPSSQNAAIDATLSDPVLRPTQELLMGAQQQILQEGPRLVGGKGGIVNAQNAEGFPQPPPADPKQRELLTQEQVDQEFGHLGLKYSAPVPRAVAAFDAHNKQAEMRRQEILQNAPAGVLPSLARLGAGFLGGSVDPLNIAAGFIPVFGPAARSGLTTALGPLLARGLEGAAAGAIGVGAVQPVTLAMSRQLQLDYSMSDALYNVAFGSLLGGGLHMAGGALRDRLVRYGLKNKIGALGSTMSEAEVKSFGEDMAKLPDITQGYREALGAGAMRDAMISGLPDPRDTRAAIQPVPTIHASPEALTGAFHGALAQTLRGEVVNVAPIFDVDQSLNVVTQKTVALDASRRALDRQVASTTAAVEELMAAYRQIKERGRGRPPKADPLADSKELLGNAGITPDMTEAQARAQAQRVAVSQARAKGRGMLSREAQAAAIAPHAEALKTMAAGRDDWAEYGDAYARTFETAPPAEHYTEAEAEQYDADALALLERAVLGEEPLAPVPAIEEALAPKPPSPGKPAEAPKPEGAPKQPPQAPVPPGPEQGPLKAYSAKASEAIPAGQVNADGAAGVFKFDASKLETDAERLQFKGGGDKFGVTDKLKHIKAFSQTKAGQLIVWEALDGKVYVANGHQRVGLAKRIKAENPNADTTVTGVLYREKDGVTVEQVRALAAAANIAEGSGSVIDMAKVARNAPELMGESLRVSDEKQRMAFDLTQLSDSSFGLVVNEVVPYQYAAMVGRLLPDDEVRQSAAMNLLAKAEPASLAEASSLIQQVKAEAVNVETQNSLFGEEQIATSLVIEKSKVMAAVGKELRQNKKLFSALMKQAGKIEAAGNVLAEDANKAQARQSGELLQIIETLAYKKGPVADALTQAAQQVKDGIPVKTAGRSLIESVIARGPEIMGEAGRGPGEQAGARSAIGQGGPSGEPIVGDAPEGVTLRDLMASLPEDDPEKILDNIKAALDNVKEFKLTPTSAEDQGKYNALVAAGVPPFEAMNQVEASPFNDIEDLAAKGKKAPAPATELDVEALNAHAEANTAYKAAGGLGDLAIGPFQTILADLVAAKTATVHTAIADALENLGVSGPKAKAASADALLKAYGKVYEDFLAGKAMKGIKPGAEVAHYAIKNAGEHYAPVKPTFTPEQIKKAKDAALQGYPFPMSESHKSMLGVAMQYAIDGKLADEEAVKAWFLAEGFGEGPAEASAKTVMDSYKIMVKGATKPGQESSTGAPKIAEPLEGAPPSINSAIINLTNQVAGNLGAQSHSAKIYNALLHTGKLLESGEISTLGAAANDLAYELSQSFAGTGLYPFNAQSLETLATQLIDTVGQLIAQKAMKGIKPGAEVTIGGPLPKHTSPPAAPRYSDSTTRDMLAQSQSGLVFFSKDEQRRLQSQGSSYAKVATPEQAAARQARREEMGYTTVAFRGGAKFQPFQAFGMRTRGEGEVQGAVFFSDKPEIAKSYAGGAQPEGGGVTYPVYLRTKGFKEVNWYEEAGSTEYGGQEMTNIIKQARQEGYPGVIIKGIRDVGGTQTQYAVLENSAIRGWFARFDPEERFSGDYLARLADEQGLPPEQIKAQIDVANAVIARLPADLKVKIVTTLPGGAQAGYAARLKTLYLTVAALDYSGRLLRHEEIHALRDLGLFTPQEWALLEERGQALRAQYKIDERYRGWLERNGYSGAALEAKLREEAVARMVEDFKGGTRFGSAIDRILQAIVDFFDRLRNAANGAGFQTADDVMRRIETGEIGQRARSAQAPQEGMAASLKEPTPEQRQVLDMLDRGASPQEIQAHPYIQRSIAVHDTLDDRFKKASFDRKTAQYVINGESVTGYDKAVAYSVAQAKAAAGVPIRQERKGIIIMGAPASGKSTHAERLARENGAALLDSDEMKKIIPGYNDGLGAGAAHLESNAILGSTFRDIMSEGDNLVIQKVGAYIDSITNAAKALRDHGYSVEIVHVNVDPAEAFRRSIRRFIETGRLVTPEYMVRDVDGNPKRNYDKLKGENYAEATYTEIDNNKPMEAAPGRAQAPLADLSGYGEGGRGGNAQGAGRPALDPQILSELTPWGEQLVLPGAEKIGEATKTQRQIEAKSKAPMRGEVAQKESAGPLFDDYQTDLLEHLRLKRADENVQKALDLEGPIMGVANCMARRA